MSRNCVVCNNNKHEVLSIEELNVVGIGDISIGVSICKKCGCVLQDPIVPQKKMNAYYSQFSNYTNVGNDYSPSNEKINLITQQVKFCLKNLPEIPNIEKNLFQVGCSNGFTLSIFKNNGWDVTGIDPSSLCAKLAKKNYEIEIFTGFFENLMNLKKYKLFVITHVLEHLYLPKETLQKIYHHTLDGGYLFVEIPCFKDADKFPNGYFSFEHIQFFSENLISDLLNQTGFDILAKRHIFHEYPIISLVCKKRNSVSKSYISNSTEYENNYSLVLNHLMKENQTWSKIKSELHSKLNSKDRIFLWGAGIHTSKLFFHTKLLDSFKITRIIDNDPQKHGLKFLNIEISDPQKIDFKKGDQIIISSYSSENEIFDSIKNLVSKGVTIFKLYN